MTTSSRVLIKDSIAAKLLKAVFSIYVLVAVAVTLLHMVIEYHNTKKTIIEELKVIHKTIGPGLASALWDENASQLKLSISGMVNIPMVVGIKIQDETGSNVGEVGVVVDHKGEVIHRDVHGHSIQASQDISEVFWYEAALIYIDDGEVHKVGVATLYSDTNVALRRVQLGFLLLIFNAAIKTFFLWIIFLWMGQKLLSRPLQNLTKTVGQLDLDNLGHARVDVQADDRNELKILGETFNAMIKKMLLSRSRSVSLRRLANNIANFQDTTQILCFAFQELCPYMDTDGAGFYFDVQEGHFTQSEMYDNAEAVLKKEFASEWLDHLFSNDTEQIVLFSNVGAYWAISRLFAGSPEEVEGGHFLGFRPDSRNQHVVFLYRDSGKRPFGNSDVDYIQSILTEVHLAQRNIDTIHANARMEGELKTAAAVQQALFPQELPHVDNLDLSVFFQSASETGGDWYGFLSEIENALYVLIGDVTGHGTPAALVTATACGTCKTLEGVYAEATDTTHRTISPVTILQNLNKVVMETGQSEFLMTFFAARIDLDSGVMTFSNAAHNFPIVIRADGKQKRLLGIGKRLGDQAGAVFTEKTFQLELGDLLFFFTDGLTEMENEDEEMWGEQRLIRYLQAHKDLPLEELVHAVTQESYQFSNYKPLDDDVTIIACRVEKPFVS